MAGYDAFISYSRSGEGNLAPALHAGLQRLAKPWAKRRALEVFRDETGLTANPDLWGSIVEALDSSRWFILMASPQAADSKWVNQEIETWLAGAPDAHERILPVLTSGTLHWDDETNTFTADTDAAPSALAAALTSEPRYIDLSWAHDDEQLDLNNPQFRQAVAEIAAPIHGVTQDALIGEDVRQHRRAVRIRRIATASLIALTIGAIGASVAAVLNARTADKNALEAKANAAVADANALEAEANALEAEVNAQEARDRQREAEENAAISKSREFAATAQALLDQDPELATLLAVEALWPDPTRPVKDFATPEAEAALRNALNQLLLTDTYPLAARVETNAHAIAISPDGSLMATTDDGRRVDFWNIATGEASGDSIETGTEFNIEPWAEHPLDLRFSPDGSKVLMTGTAATVVVDVVGRSAEAVDDSSGVATWLSDGTLVHSDASGRSVMNRATATSPSVTLATISNQPVGEFEPDPIRALLVTASGELVVASSDDQAWRVPQDPGGDLASFVAPRQTTNYRSNAVWAADPIADVVHRYSLTFNQAPPGLPSTPDYPVTAIPISATNVPGFPAHTSFPVAAGTLALSDDGAFAAAVNGLDRQGLPDIFVGVPPVGPDVQVWNPSVLGSTFTIPTNQASDVAWMPGGRVLAIAAQGGVDFYRVNGSPLPSSTWAMDGAADWSRLVTWDAVSNGALSVWEPPFVEPSRRLEGIVGLEGESVDERFPDMFTIDPDGSEASLLVYSGDISVIDLTTGARRILQPPRSDLRFEMPISYSPDGESLLVGATGADDTGRLLIINATSGAIEHETEVGDSFVAGPVAWVDDGSTVLFTLATQLGVRPGELAEYSLDSQAWRRFEPSVTPTALDVSGQRVVAGLDDGDVLVIEPFDGSSVGANIRRYRLHASAVRAVAISDDGSRIGSAADELVLSDAATGEVSWTSASVPALEVEFGWRSVQFNEEGRSIVAGGAEGFALISDFDPVLACRTPRPDAFERLEAITGQTSACERIPELSSPTLSRRPSAAGELPPILPATVSDVGSAEPAEPTDIGEASSADICPPYTPNEVLPLSERQRGTNVQIAQNALISVGYAVDADGCFGPGTATAVRAFQRTFGLAVDGLIGPATWQALTGQPAP